MTDDIKEHPQKAPPAIPRTDDRFKLPDGEPTCPTTHPSTSRAPEMLFVLNSSSEQPENDASLMLVMLSGITIVRNFGQS